jgi:cytochrome b561
MADPPSYPDSGEDTRVGPDRESATGTPRWLSVAGIIIAIVLVVLFIVLHLTGILGPGAH